jgi:uncharacterized protein with ParB-like and HNH nuclease domain
MNISDIFSADSHSILDFFTNRCGSGKTIGFNIPQYQRPYSWKKSDIKRLIDDICNGVRNFVNQSCEQNTTVSEIHFIGTVMTIDCLAYTKQREKQALPSKIENVIDGQQRISSIVLIAICLYHELSTYLEDLPEEEKFEILRECVQDYIEQLKSIFSFKKNLGGSHYLPTVIRESKDFWTIDEKNTEDGKKASQLFKFSQGFIKSDKAGDEEIKIFWECQRNDKNNIISINSVCILDCLDGLSDRDSDYFLPSFESVKNFVDETDFWGGERSEEIDKFYPEYSEAIDKIVRYILFSNFFLNRCCLTLIKPVSEVRAFDMFQSLNATGSPLTAIETFKPFAVKEYGEEYNNSQAKKYFESIDSLFFSQTEYSSKDRRTNKFLTSFFNAYLGEKISNQFSCQFSTLKKQYQDAKTDKDPKGEEFLRKLGQSAEYFQIFAEGKSGNKMKKYINDLPGECDNDLVDQAVFSIFYIKAINHEIGHSLLIRFYVAAKNSNDRDENDLSGMQVFCEACRLVAALFTLWKSSLRKKYPDSEYRKVIKKIIPWKLSESDHINIQKLRIALKNIFIDKLLEVYSLKSQEIEDRDQIRDFWIKKAVSNIRHDESKALCKFALLVEAHEAIEDTESKGLFKRAVKGGVKHLNFNRWESKDLAEIEHVAPQSPDYLGGWDTQIYENDKLHTIGNLTLLPKKVNISAGNKSWNLKRYYFDYLSAKDGQKIKKIEEELKQLIPEQSLKSTLEILAKSEYADHVKAFKALDDTEWDSDFIDRRSTRILEILFDQVYPWLIGDENKEH